MKPNEKFTLILGYLHLVLPIRSKVLNKLPNFNVDSSTKNVENRFHLNFLSNAVKSSL